MSYFTLAIFTYCFSIFLANLIISLPYFSWIYLKILNTEDLIRRFSEETIPAGYKMISFDVKSLFTNVNLDKTIDYLFKKVHDEKKIQTNIPKVVLKELLYPCTKQLYLTFNNSIYMQCDGVAMGSPLGLLLANIFMTPV